MFLGGRSCPRRKKSRRHSRTHGGREREREREPPYPYALQADQAYGQESFLGSRIDLRMEAVEGLTSRLHAEIGRDVGAGGGRTGGFNMPMTRDYGPYGGGGMSPVVEPSGRRPSRAEHQHCAPVDRADQPRRNDRLDEHLRSTRIKPPMPEASTHVRFHDRHSRSPLRRPSGRLSPSLEEGMDALNLQDMAFQYPPIPRLSEYYPRRLRPLGRNSVPERQIPQPYARFPPRHQCVFHCRGHQEPEPEPEEHDDHRPQVRDEPESSSPNQQRNPTPVSGSGQMQAAEERREQRRPSVRNYYPPTVEDYYGSWSSDGSYFPAVEEPLPYLYLDGLYGLYPL